MPVQTIKITITDGAAVVETRGFKGKACKEATKELEKALGQTTSDHDTAEMREMPARVAQR